MLQCHGFCIIQHSKTTFSRQNPHQNASFIKGARENASESPKLQQEVLLFHNAFWEHAPPPPPVFIAIEQNADTLLFLYKRGAF